MSFNLRGAILANVQGSSEDQVEATITDAMASGEEKMLPGLGVLFEVYWRNADENQKQQMVTQITNGLQR
ncbi:MAG: small acid-soluble spore protein SspI [Bacillaceae bacterium]|uniref:Small, acid-soluble spore protein I n=1 Tax=Alkalihalobacterium chitinilyticum TaxID=2980103 RepID=A0ABT5VCZ5_9BACI|nr:small acid-soluble spore protein SspI [Alkalihalobacterium chitinilyticum]MDE5412363.1 small acid-soluble spore protein SspI [Alkalihalobacterium chitinilyticum]MEB1807735.1 small acid-soluble spore protein SspI [Bacillaceae bacterium]